MNHFGRLFQINLFGESHGFAVGVLIDGCPPGIEIPMEELQAYLDRRKPGQLGTTPRKETDVPEFMSGIEDGKTTGTPILIIFQNQNMQGKDYDDFLQTPRPGHADFVAQHKFRGFANLRGGGHFSARVTVGMVAAGFIAQKILSSVEIMAEIVMAGGNQDIKKAVKRAVEENDSIGALIRCMVKNLPVGLGEPFFDSMESVLAHVLFSIPAVKGVSFGSGFQAAVMKGSEHNDIFIDKTGKTKTNYAGGINGGISNGNEVIIDIAFKPTASIGKTQTTMNMKTGLMEELVVKGRHDACVALRAPVIVESAVAIALADLWLIEKTR